MSIDLSFSSSKSYSQGTPASSTSLRTLRALYLTSSLIVKRRKWTNSMYIIVKMPADEDSCARTDDISKFEEAEEHVVGSGCGWFG